MSVLPPSMHTHNTARAIFKLYEEREAKNPPRPYLGASIIGKNCDRMLWYNFRQVALVTFEGRMLRLFDTGHREETRFVEELRGLGCEVHEVDPETKEQFEVNAVNGHFSGHMDGVARGLPEAPKSWALLEFKTHNAKSFAELVKVGVRKHKPEHWAQMQTYMGLGKLDRALYLARNKDNDDLYPEWIHFDKAECDKYLARAERIIYAKEPPAKMSDDPAFWLCKFCDFYDVCHGEQPARKNCRTCVNATPCNDRDGGKWTCDKGSQRYEIPNDVQLEGCPEHLFIPPLLKYATAVDAGDDWISYEHNKTKRSFVNVGASTDPESVPEQVEASYTSDELAQAPGSIVTDPTIDDIKAQFPGATITACTKAEPKPDQGSLAV